MICLSVCLQVCDIVCVMCVDDMSVCRCVIMSVCVCVSVCLSVCLSVYQPEYCCSSPVDGSSPDCLKACAFTLMSPTPPFTKDDLARAFHPSILTRTDGFT